MDCMHLERLGLVREIVDEVSRILADASDGALPEVLTTTEAAEFLRVSRKTLDEYSDRGFVPHRRLGRVKLFSRQALLDWLASEASPAKKGGG